MKYSMLLGFLVLVSIAGAELETVEMGPCEISFDMGDIEYELSECSVTDEETYVGIGYTRHLFLMNTNDGFILTEVVEYDQLSGIQFDRMYSAVSANMDNDPYTYIRTIDDKSMVMFTDIESNSDLFWIVHVLECDEWTDPDGEFTADRDKDADAYMNGENVMQIISYADWDVTRQFLNTVHVECMSE